MTRDELLTFTTSLLNGYVLSDELFDALLHVKQANIEALRPWKVLQKLDTSLTVTSGNTYLTLKTLPSSFLRLTSDNPVRLYDASGSPTYCEEIPMDARFEYKDDFGKFYIDHAQGKIAFCGDPHQTLTAQISYVSKPVDIDGSNPWPFPSWCHPILAYDVAIDYKGGIDYDPVSEAQARYNERARDELWKAMVTWDTNLQVGALTGLNRSVPGVGGFTPGQINIHR